MGARLIAFALIGIGFGPIVAVGITPIFCFLRVIVYVPFIRNKLREKAEREGHLVEAKCIKWNSDSDTPSREMGIYQYQVNGKTYRRWVSSYNGIADTIKLYYIKNPKKAVTANYLGTWEQPWLKCYLIISLVSAVVTTIACMVIFGMK